MLTAGALRHRVSVRTRTETDSGYTGLTVTEAVLHARIPARVRPLAGRDLERARQIDPRISHEVTLRYWRDYRTDLSGGRCELVYHPSSDSAEDRTLEIVAPPVDVDERHVELTLLCKEAQ